MISVLFQVRLLPEKLFVALECLLDDDHEDVYHAAAIALYTLQRPGKKVQLENNSSIKIKSFQIVHLL